MASDDSSPAASLEKQKRGIRRKKSASQLELLEKVYAGTKCHKILHFFAIPRQHRICFPHIPPMSRAGFYNVHSVGHFVLVLF
jgi:hypothetical protein